MSELKLLPCPFCGGAATVGASEYYDGANTFYIYCASCGVQQMTTKIRTDEAIAAWNRRAQPENEPLVRCGNCKHYNRIGCVDGFGWCERMDRGTDDDFYCSLVERSEG